MINIEDFKENIQNLSSIQRTQEVLLIMKKEKYGISNYKTILKSLENEIEEFKNSETIGERAEELGDIFFNLINLAGVFDLDLENCLGSSINKTLERFQIVSTLCQEEKASSPEKKVDFEEMQRFHAKSKAIIDAYKKLQWGHSKSY